LWALQAHDRGNVDAHNGTVLTKVEPSMTGMLQSVSTKSTFDDCSS